ncbi:MAG: T9SS type A sorting domain-containing protein, partial [Flavobacteriales bacterium]
SPDCGAIEGNGNTMSLIEKQLINLSVFPNPFTNQIRITSEEEIKTISLYDMQGKLISSWNQNPSKSLVLDVQKVKAGIYLLLVNSNAQLIIKN